MASQKEDVATRFYCGKNTKIGLGLRVAAKLKSVVSER